jgi:phosphatidylglycerophosphatase A
MFLNPTSFLWVMTGFVVFRLFDIIKPFPASFFDRRVGGAGVMLDDLAAGIYANLVVRVARMIV